MTLAEIAIALIVGGAVGYWIGRREAVAAGTECLKMGMRAGLGMAAKSYLELSDVTRGVADAREHLTDWLARLYFTSDAIYADELDAKKEYNAFRHLARDVSWVVTGRD
jgi:hypothetical protein